MRTLQVSFVLSVLFVAMFTGKAIRLVGSALNMAVLHYNGGKMPIDLEKVPLWLQSDLIDEGHTAMNSETKLPFLCDWISVREGAMSMLARGARENNDHFLAPTDLINLHRGVQPLMASPGDVGVYLGIWVTFFAFYAIWAWLFFQVIGWAFRKWI